MKMGKVDKINKIFKVNKINRVSKINRIYRIGRIKSSQQNLLCEHCYVRTFSSLCIKRLKTKLSIFFGCVLREKKPVF